MANKFITGEVDIEHLLEKLAFAQEETESAAAEQAKLYMAAVAYRVRKMRSRQMTEMAVDNLRTDYSIKLRVNKKGQKLTEKALAELVDRVPEIREAERAAAKAKRLEAWAMGLIEAYEHRRSAIKVLAQYAFIQDVFSGKGETDRLKAMKSRLRRDIGREVEE